MSSFRPLDVLARAPVPVIQGAVLCHMPTSARQPNTELIFAADPLHISWYWKPQRVVFFCGLEDYEGTRGNGYIRRLPPSHWTAKVGLSTPAPWVQGYTERAKALRLVPPEDMYGLGPMGGSCCANWEATWAALKIPGQAWADDVDGKMVLVPTALGGAHRLYLRGEHQGHGTPISDCNPLGPTDPFQHACCAFCGPGVASCANGNCSKVKHGMRGCPECAATDSSGVATLEPVWKYLFTSINQEHPLARARDSDRSVGRSEDKRSVDGRESTAPLPTDLQMHCCGNGKSGGGFCCHDPTNLTGIKHC